MNLSIYCAEEQCASLPYYKSMYDKLFVPPLKLKSIDNVPFVISTVHMGFTVAWPVPRMPIMYVSFEKKPINNGKTYGFSLFFTALWQWEKKDKATNW